MLPPPAHESTNRHYKRASGALLVYDVTSRSSFENAEKVWLRELKNAADSNSSLLDSLVLVGNKVGRCCGGKLPQTDNALVTFHDSSLKSH